MLFLSVGHNPFSPGVRLGSKVLIEHWECADICRYITNYLCKEEKKELILVPSGTLAEKVEFINVNGAKDDIAIEIHLNAFDGSTKGKEILCYPSHTTKAERMLFIMDKYIKNKNRGVKPPIHHSGKPLYFLKQTKCPAFIIEPYFMDAEDFDSDIVGLAIAKAINGVKSK